jgi:23S rRNA-/tRNA-specific pseudouridylate synthase
MESTRTRERIRTSVDSVEVLYYHRDYYCIVNKPYDIRTDNASATSPDEITLEKLTHAAISKLEAATINAIATTATILSDSNTTIATPPSFVPPPLRPCHQLDLATSGVMCYALSTQVSPCSLMFVRDQKLMPYS